jgi:ADP-ribosylation factor related protein 1
VQGYVRLVLCSKCGSADGGIESVIHHQDTADIPVLMLANKQDLPTSLKVEEIQQAGFTRIAEAMSARDSRVLPISALTGYVPHADLD